MQILIERRFNRMKYKFLGNTGLKVSELVFGTQTFGWGADEKTAHEMADIYIETGGNFFDTANIYNAGVSESMLGSWIKKRGKRHSLIIASKVFFPVGEGPNDTGLSRKHIFRSIDESLRRLQTEYIDLYQLHCFDMSTPLDETFRALDDIARSGKVRYLGVSNYTASQIMKVLMVTKMNGFLPISSLQAEYSLIVRSTEWELLPLCDEEGLGFLAWSPLAGGWLTGKYRRGANPPSDSRVGRRDRWDDQPEQRESELTWRAIDILIEIGKNHNKTPAQVALNWVLNQPGVTAPIFGARNIEQLKDNLGSTGWQLSEDEADSLKKATEIPLPYPYSFIQRYTRRR
jgi:aryl-alcohol dehydrogenase-like predicted oxidoreductase